MPPKKRKAQTKHGEVDLAQQVIATDMTAKEANMEELTSLIRRIMREELDEAINGLQPQLNAVKEQVLVCATKIGEIEASLCSFDSRITKLEGVNESLRKDNDELKEKTERLESHNRKYNVLVMGLTSDVEKGNPTSYMSQLLKELFSDKLQLEPEVEVAHRVGFKSKSGQWVMIVRLQRLVVRDEIVWIAKEERVLEVRGMKLPDISSEMAKIRDVFETGDTKKCSNHLAAETYLKTVIEPELDKQDMEEAR
ncbi:unnamed protein product [Leuciscus chuanchicus]